jgi:hypothetical protein
VSRRIRLLPRGAALLVLAWLLLLAGQQIALLHPLGHLGQTEPAQTDRHAGTQGDAHLPDGTAPACDLCLASAAAGHLAAATPTAAPSRGGLVAISNRTGWADASRRAAWRRHSRGPPARA